MTNAYGTFLTWTVDKLDRFRLFSLCGIAAVVAGYYWLLFHQLRPFLGPYYANASQLLGTRFLTREVVIPWCVYALFGLFVPTYLVYVMMGGASRQTSNTKEHGPGMLAAALTGTWFCLPYGLLVVASYLITPCGSELDECERLASLGAKKVVTQGGGPKYRNVDELIKEIELCTRCMDLNPEFKKTIRELQGR